MIFLYSGQARASKIFKHQLRKIREEFADSAKIVCCFWNDDLIDDGLKLILERYGAIYQFVEKIPCENDLLLSDNDNYALRVISQFQGIENSVKFLFESCSGKLSSSTKVARMRSDLIVDEQHLKYIREFRVEPGSIYFPHVGHYIGVNDMFWISDLKSISNFSFLGNFTRMFADRPGSLCVPEIIIREFSQANNLAINFDLWGFPSLLARQINDKFSPHNRFKVNYYQHKNRAMLRGFGGVDNQRPPFISRLILEIMANYRCFCQDIKKKKICIEASI